MVAVCRKCSVLNPARSLHELSLCKRMVTAMLSGFCQLEAERISHKDGSWTVSVKVSSMEVLTVTAQKNKSLLKAIFNVAPIHRIFGSSARSSKGQPLSWHTYHLPPML